VAIVGSSLALMVRLGIPKPIATSRH
jgi:hypothetical protein